jgi:hypothetical protein
VGGGWISYVPIFKIDSKILLGKLVCFPLCCFTDEASVRM